MEGPSVRNVIVGQLDEIFIMGDGLIVFGN